MAQKQWSGLRDRNGKRIHCGDRLRFFYRDGCIWDGTVTFEDGVYTVSIQDATQIANPRTWEHMFNWVASRNWACLVGYGEMGTWNFPRAPLTKIAEGWATYEDVKVLYEKYDYTDGRILQVEVVKKVEVNPIADAHRMIAAFDAWFKKAFHIDDRMMNPGLRSEMLSAFRSGWEAKSTDKEAG